MSATSFEVTTLVFPDPALVGPQNVNFRQANTTISFNFLQSQGITTLSTNGVTSGAEIRGLLYTPALSDQDPCLNASAPYVPQNVTTQTDLPNFRRDLVAIAPWISPQCTQNYLASARLVPTQSFVFFLPSQGESTPPKANDPAWDLGDGGHWKNDNDFPVYAITTSSGEFLVGVSAEYSGNITSVPFGEELSQTYGPGYYARLAMDIETGSGGGLPSLWTFLIIILGILLAIVGLVSLTMHLLLRRRRASLRRRVASGEVNLETLGIKRLTVPQELLDKMPLYTYSGGKTGTNVEPNAPQAETVSEKTGISTRHNTAHPDHDGTGTTIPMRSQFEQPTCAICLEDFTHNESTVRQLPCEHIFHPECVDTFLRDNSSLCPLCKVSALPKGYCPAIITNAMVRRERHLGRLRPRAYSHSGHDVPHNESAMSRAFGWLGRRNDPEDVELVHPSTSPVPPPTSSPPPPTQHGARREWARRRALSMLGPRPAPTEVDTGASSSPRWRKLLRKVFP